MASRAKPKINNCAGCVNVIKGKDFLRCSVCSEPFDLFCAFISPDDFKSMTKDVKNAWICQTCKSKLPKKDNTNTPLRPGKTCEGSTSKDGADANYGKNDYDNITIQDQVISAIKSELPRMLSDVVKTELTDIKKDLQELLELRRSVAFLSEMHDEMKNNIASLTKDNVQLKRDNCSLLASVNELSDRLNSLEQHSRDNNLEIQGVPEHRTESIPNLVQTCAAAVGYQLNDIDVVHCTRVAKQNKESKLPRSIVVKLRTIRCRDEFFSAVHRYNKANPSDKLNTSLLGIAGDKRPVYVSEHLSPANKSLHAMTRKKAKEMSYKFVWVRNSRIYVRKDPESQYILIKNVKCLDLLK